MAALAGEAELLALQGAAHQALPVVGGGVHRRAAAGDVDVEGFGSGVGCGRSGGLEETTKENGITRIWELGQRLNPVDYFI